MQSAGRFDRYSVSRNPDGKFEIYGKNGATAVVELNVCQFCLGMLNYKGAAESSRRRWQVAQEFDINEFFANYSSLFKKLPREKDHSIVGYTNDWPEISNQVREQTNYTCQSCNVMLSHHKNLLHVHHKNGVKHDNAHTNLEVLCADCHRKEPCHQCMHVSHSDIQLINRLRQEQGIITSNMSWDDVFKFADPAILATLSHARNLGYMPPVVSFTLTDKQGKIIKVVEAAWPDKKEGVYLGEPPPALDGWKFFRIQTALDPKKGLGGQDQLSF
ncbi:HNH endonuclease [Endozoicomonas sp. ONNA2]|uniref:HNH endonuclease n=1 Tax=Endozoicomonas sp. ONNA2 TaxID=2828741 RepID=UPI002148FBF5|nr:HNH endonuclease signature motif containing protein [Endozoicomonas sp. ONNA2]